MVHISEGLGFCDSREKVMVDVTSPCSFLLSCNVNVCCVGSCLTPCLCLLPFSVNSVIYRSVHYRHAVDAAALVA